MTETPPQSPATRQGTRALAITVGVVGGSILLLGGATTAVGAVADTIRAADVDGGAASVETAGIERVKIDVSAAYLGLDFDGASDATLDYQSDSGPWTFERNGSTLVVSSPQPRFSLFDWSREQSARLTLPEELEGVDLELDLAAGEVNAEGTFGDVAYDLNAGMVEIEGSADSVDGDVAAGGSVVELADVQKAKFEVAAGDITAELTGEPPSEVRVRVAAGSVDVQLPDVPYDVRTNRAAGDLSSSLEDSPTSDRVVDVSITAGDVTLAAN